MCGGLVLAWCAARVSPRCRGHVVDDEDDEDDEHAMGVERGNGAVEAVPFAAPGVGEDRR